MIRINLLAEARPQRKKKGVSALGAGGRLNTLLLGGAIGLAILIGVIHYWVLHSQIKAQEEKIRIAQVEVMNPFRSIFTDDRAVDAAWLSEASPSLAIAVGLGVRKIGE